MVGKHESCTRSEKYGQKGPYSMLTLSLKYAWIDLATLFLVHGFNPNKYQVCDLLKALKTSFGGISEECEPFVQCLFTAGYRRRNGDEKKVAEFISSHEDIISVQMQKLLKDSIHDKVKTLKHLCCLCIRSHLRTACQGRSILNSISKLPIPKVLQDFLSTQIYLETTTEDSYVELDYHSGCEYLHAYKINKIGKRKQHVYIQFWRASCCCSK